MVGFLLLSLSIPSERETTLRNPRVEFVPLNHD